MRRKKHDVARRYAIVTGNWL